MDQESSRNPKHRPAAEKAGKPRAGGTPPKRSSGSRATAASHGKSPAKKPTATRPTGTQNRKPAAKKPTANTTAKRPRRKNLRGCAPQMPCRPNYNLHEWAGGSPPRCFSASNIRPHLKGADGRPAIDSESTASLERNVGLSGPVTHPAGPVKDVVQL